MSACGSEPATSSPVDVTPATTTPTATTPADGVPPTTEGGSSDDSTPGTDDDVASDGGWVGGEPEWFTDGEGSGGRSSSASGAAEEMSVAGDVTSAPAVADASDAADIEPGPEPMPVPVPGDTGPLRAGSVDDNADFEAYIAYLDRIESLGIALRSFDPRFQIPVTVTGANGLPVSGAEVVVSISAGDGEPVTRLRTAADGIARFFPEMFHAGADVVGYEFSVGDFVVPWVPGEPVMIELSTDGGAVAPVPVDVLFLLDATGSMADEIERLKSNIDAVASRVAALESLPDVRFAMTLYRDEGDAFVTATHDFTGDVDAFRTALAEVVADGGGDYPEALDEGLAEALTVPTWRDPASTVQMVFLVADAPPQVGRQVEQGYAASILDAGTRGIKVFPVASSESDDQAEAVFRQIAQGTGGRFVFLTYGAGGAATGESTDINSTDYEELALDDLIVRLVAEELAGLTGDDTTVPPPTPTTSTIPDGQ